MKNLVKDIRQFKEKEIKIANKHGKCSISLAIRKHILKPQRDHYFTHLILEKNEEVRHYQVFTTFGGRDAIHTSLFTVAKKWK